MTSNPTRQLLPLQAQIHSLSREGKRIAVLCLGNELFSDDAAGVSVAKLIAEKSPPNIRTFSGGIAPENITGEVVAFKPELIIIVDAADMGLPPGSVAILDKDALESLSFSTHSIPVEVFISYFENRLGCSSTVVGIQPSAINFDGLVSEEVKEACEWLAEAICTD